MKKEEKLMKKIVSLFLVILMLTPCLSVFTSAVENEVTVILNGFEIVFDVPGRLIDGRTMVPLRRIGECLGATVEWDGATRGIKLIRNDDVVELSVGSYDLYKNGVLTYKMDVAPIIVEEEGTSRTLVPLRAISEAFGCLVDWEGTTRSALIADIPDAAVMNIGAYPVTKDLYHYFVIQTISEIANIGDIKSDSEEITEIEDMIVDKIVYFNSIKSYASELGLSIYDPLVSDGINASLADYKHHYGDLFAYILQSSNMTEETFLEFLYVSYFETELMNAITALSENISADAKAEAMMNDENFIRAAHILVEDEESAKSIYDLAKSSSDDKFLELMNQYSLDEGKSDYPYGYYFGKDQMVESFDKAAYSLDIGETSDIVKSEFGYHIIRRLEKDQPYLYENADFIFSDYINYKFYDDLNTISKSLKESCVYYPLYENIDLYNEYILPLQETIKDSATDTAGEKSEEAKTSKAEEDTNVADDSYYYYDDQNVVVDDY